MLGPALRQLFEDLDHASDRTSYEEALHQELKPLALVSQYLVGQVHPISFQSPSIFGRETSQAAVAAVNISVEPVVYSGAGVSVSAVGVSTFGVDAGVSANRIQIGGVEPIQTVRISNYQLGGNDFSFSKDRVRSDTKRVSCPKGDCPNKRI
jgi:hypothetical protein